jgi:hypothetical protein
MRPVADARRFTHLLCGQLHVREPAVGDDEAVAALAGAQHGIVSRRQLRDLGLGARAIEHRLRCGRLRRLFGGVYAVGHEALTGTGRCAAAVLSTTPGSCASHWSAAGLHGLLDQPRPVVHISVVRPRRPRPGVLIHRAALPAADLTACDGVPATSVARTLLDLSASLDERRLRTIAKRAEYRGLVSARDLIVILRRHPRRRGRRQLAKLVAGPALNTGRTASPLEDDFLEFCARRAIPIPETNVLVSLGARDARFDCVWREARLVVELDGRAAHARELAFEDDRARDRAAIAAGWRPMRITSAQLRASPDALERDLRAALRIDTHRFTPPGCR